MASAVRLLALVVPLCGLASALACSSSDGDEPASKPDAGILDSAVQNEAATAHSTTIKTTAPSSSRAAAGLANAKLAARLAEDGTTWTVLAPKDTGVYEIATNAARWTAAFICADDNDNVVVSIYERDASVPALDVELGQPCASVDGVTVDLTGTFSHAPTTTSWFDFGYAEDDRGSVLPLNGDRAEYEIPNVVKGTWDLVFGFRDDGSSPLTKLYIARAQNLSADLVLDGDLSASGITPVPKNLIVTGLATGETFDAPIVYAVGTGLHGVDVGPLSHPTTGTTTYATLPPASQASGDLYRVAITAKTQNGDGVRGATGSFHTAADLAITLPAALPAPKTTTAATTPYLRVATQTVGRAAAASYELVATTRITDQESHVWTYSTDAVVADGAPLTITLPDLSAIAGWSSAWALTTTNTTISAKEIEKPIPLSDGTITLYASTGLPLAP